MNASVLIGPSALLLSTLLLSGCGNSYLLSPDSPPLTSDSSRYDGNWTGPLESRYRLRPLGSSRSFYKAIVCDTYQDRIRLDVRQGRIAAELGQDTGYSISAQLDDSGRFYQRVTLSANGNRHPGKTTELSIAGHIDPGNGIARGTVMVTPGRYSIGCLGDFVAYSDAGRGGLSSNIVPFSTEYHFTEFRDHK